MRRRPLIARILFAKKFSMKKLVLGAVIIPVIAAWSLFHVTSEGISADAQTGATDHWIKSQIEALRLAATSARQQKIVQELVLKLGPEQAQDELLHSGLPFTGDSHLVIHTVGTMIYEKYGLEGIAHCRPYFLGACYHGFLIEAIGQRGPQVIAEVWAQCKNAGAAILPQCAHAVGHGLLVWKNNSIPDALAVCDSLAKDIDSFVPLNCYDGVFMENIWGPHLHEQRLMASLLTNLPSLSPESMASQPVCRRPTIGNDLEYPCDDPRLKPRYLRACWGNQVSLLYRAFQGDLAKVGGKCLSLADSENKEACFDGLARQIQPMTHGKADEAFRLCKTAVAAPWRNNCLAVIASADFSMGDQSIAPFEICKRIDANGRKECYSRLISVIALYAGQDLNRAAEMCASISEKQYVDNCTSHFHNFGQALRDEVAHRIARTQQSSGELSLDHAKVAQVPYPHPYIAPYTAPYTAPYQYPEPYEAPYPVPYPSPPVDHNGQ